MSLFLHIVQLYFISSMTFSLFAHKEKTVGCQSCRDLRFETDWSSYLWYLTVVLKTMNLYVAGHSSSFLKSLVCKSDQLTIYFLLAAVWYCWTSSSLCQTEWTTYCITDISKSFLFYIALMSNTVWHPHIRQKDFCKGECGGAPNSGNFFRWKSGIFWSKNTIYNPSKSSFNPLKLMLVHFNLVWCKKTPFLYLVGGTPDSAKVLRQQIFSKGGRVPRWRKKYAKQYFTPSLR